MNQYPVSDDPKTQEKIHPTAWCSCRVLGAVCCGCLPGSWKRGSAVPRSKCGRIFKNRENILKISLQRHDFSI